MMTDGKPEPSTPAEDDPALWSLLERAKRPGPVSPYFARRVLREVAVLEAAPAPTPAEPDWLARLWQAWHGQARGVFAGALAAVVLVAVGSGVTPTNWRTKSVSPAVQNAAATESVEPAAAVSQADPSTPPAVAADAPVAAQDVEVIADLDSVFSSEESQLWTDEDNSSARY